MTPEKLNVMFAGFSYGGNGGIAAQHPDVGKWLVKAIAAAKADPRIDKVCHIDLADTPITMTRNRAVLDARELGMDVLVMVDSDQSPDLYGTTGECKPFFESSFEFLYRNRKRFTKGCVIGSPYCGPPSLEELCYVFYWKNQQTGAADTDFKLEAYTRAHAADMVGIQECGALPTGLTMWDMRVFELTEPRDKDDDPWFYYEWEDRYAANKGSTEDVTATRDISLAGLIQEGYNPVHANWDSWAGHWKPKLVGKPQIITADTVSKKLKRSVEEGRARDIKHAVVGDGLDLEEMKRKIKASRDAASIAAQGTEPEAPFVKDDPVTRAKLVGKLDQPGGHFTPSTDLIALKALVAEAVYAKLKANDLTPFTAVEVGSWVGHSAIAIADAMPVGSVLHCVDTWDGTPGEVTGQIAAQPTISVYQSFLENIGERLGRVIIPHKGKSVEMAQGWPHKADLVFIDADHSYDAVKADIAAWWPHIRIGGTLCGHDYGGALTVGVTEAVDDYFERVSVSGACVWAIRKGGEKL